MTPMAFPSIPPDIPRPHVWAYTRSELPLKFRLPRHKISAAGMHYSRTKGPSGSASFSSNESGQVDSSSNVVPASLTSTHQSNELGRVITQWANCCVLSIKQTFWPQTRRSSIKRENSRRSPSLLTLVKGWPAAALGYLPATSAIINRRCFITTEKKIETPLQDSSQPKPTASPQSSAANNRLAQCSSTGAAQIQRRTSTKCGHWCSPPCPGEYARGS